jgi:DNA-binding CsgD family transcriptional regulator
MASPIIELENTWELCRRIGWSSDKASLQSDLLEPIACLLRAEMAVFRVFTFDEPKPTLIASLGIADVVNDAYMNRYFKFDPIREMLPHRFGGPLFAGGRKTGEWQDGRRYAAGPGTSTASMIARYRASFHRYRTEFLLQHNLWRHLGICLQDADGNRTFLLNFIRGQGAPEFDRLEFARARIVGMLLHARVAEFDSGDIHRSGCAITAKRDPGAEDEFRDTGDVDRALSARELEVAEAVALGLTNKEVGAALSISVRTVENHMRSIFAKLEVSTRTRLAAKLRQRRSNGATM